MEANFKFHPVGQGCFYSGGINNFGFRHRNNTFNCVYDCGTLSERQLLYNEINSFKNRLNYSELDVLFLSHLDDDHINGVSNLLNGITCKHIYLPYLTPIQRLYVVIKHKPKNTNDYDDFIRFIESPHDYLLNIDDSEIGEIIYIYGNSDGKVNIDDFPNKPIKPDEINFELQDDLEFLSEDELSRDMKEIISIDNNRIKFKKGNKTISLHRIWEFYLYHIPAIQEQVKELIQAINDLYNFKLTDEITQSELVTILGNKDYLKELRKCYRKIFKNLNKTGLIVQHKPLGYEFIELYKRDIKSYFNNNFYSCEKLLRKNNFIIRKSQDYNKGVTLLTGDICLNQIEDSEYIRDHLKYVIVFQVPHHGSNTGWDSRYLENLNYRGLTSSIINFGYGNKFGHPTLNVLRDLIEYNFDIRFCTQLEKFYYWVRLYF